jgi:hypothetical protein
MSNLLGNFIVIAGARSSALLTTVAGIVDSSRLSKAIGGIREHWPNWTIYQRESRLYVDIEAYQDGELNWNAPRTTYTGLPSPRP